MIFEACGNYLESNNQQISGKTAVYGLVGDPVDHSMSPIIQNTAFDFAGLDAVYVPYRVKQSDLKSAIRGLRSVGLKGFNVTAPHKIRVSQYLDGLDSTAAQIGAVNTVLNDKQKLIGYNTDGQGALKALEEAGAPLDQTILIFGAGGASRAITQALLSHAKAIRLVNRTIAKAKQLERKLIQTHGIDITCDPLSTNRLKGLVNEANVIINASTMGMNGEPNPPIRSDWLRNDQWIFDIVYEPVETRLIKLADLAGARIVTGLDMLVNQGACSFELWTHKAAPITAMRNAIAQRTLTTTHAKSS
jgi:shikimate dehydrogenase